MICLVFCLVIASISIIPSQEIRIPNGNFVCVNNGDPENYGDFSACEDANYNSLVRVEQFGVDCCNEEARYSMYNFSNIATNIDFNIFNNATVSYQIKLLNVISLQLQKDILFKRCGSHHSNTIQASNETLQQVYTKFTSTCKRYTDIMAVKTHLQYCILDSKQSITPQHTQLIITLQTAAIKLQKMEVSDLYELFMCI